MGALTDNCDMAEDVLERVACVATFLEEVLTDARNPDEGICFSARGIDGLVYITADIRMAVQYAEKMKT